MDEVKGKRGMKKREASGITNKYRGIERWNKHRIIT